MALSSVHFRMKHNPVYETIHFRGNGIKLLDLKSEIVERKSISATFEFDLKIVDENNKGAVLFWFVVIDFACLYIFYVSSSRYFYSVLLYYRKQKYICSFIVEIYFLLFSKSYYWNEKKKERK